jgi:hypothetical protein
VSSDAAGLREDGRVDAESIGSELTRSTVGRDGGERGEGADGDEADATAFRGSSRDEA